MRILVICKKEDIRKQMGWLPIFVVVERKFHYDIHYFFTLVKLVSVRKKLVDISVIIIFFLLGCFNKSLFGKSEVLQIPTIIHIFTYPFS